MFKILCVTSLLVLVLVDSACDMKNSFDDAAANSILDAHNNMRSQISNGNYMVYNETKRVPSATNMRKMAWSCELQTAAQDWALKNNKCQLRDSRTGGENLWGKIGKEISLDGLGLAATETWESEFNTYGWKDQKFERVIGHATQMAWWHSDKIGCGYNICKDNNRALVVCRYKESGNNYRASAYDAGKTCSNCGKNLKCETATGLCVAA